MNISLMNTIKALSNKVVLKSRLGTRSAILLLSIGVTAAAGAVLLTPGFGVTCYPDGCANAVRGLFVDPTEIKFKVKEGKEEVIQVAAGGQVAAHEITIASVTPEGMTGSTGWHSHPGPVVVVIKSGTMTFYEEDCTIRTYQAGDAFVDQGGGHVHLARNEGTQPLVLWATYFGVSPGGPFRTNAPQPAGCSAF
jgi:quercetin dioxygenase-like cupin family protein